MKEEERERERERERKRDGGQNEKERKLNGAGADTVGCERPKGSPKGKPGRSWRGINFEANRTTSLLGKFGIKKGPARTCTFRIRFGGLGRRRRTTATARPTAKVANDVLPFFRHSIRQTTLLLGPSVIR